MKVIGITGGVGAGKSVVLDFIKNNYKAFILQADEVAHELMEPGMPANKLIAEAFPDAGLRGTRRGQSPETFGADE